MWFLVLCSYIKNVSSLNRTGWQQSNRAACVCARYGKTCFLRKKKLHTFIYEGCYAKSISSRNTMILILFFSDVVQPIYFRFSCFQTAISLGVEMCVFLCCYFVIYGWTSIWWPKDTAQILLALVTNTLVTTVRSRRDAKVD